MTDNQLELLIDLIFEAKSEWLTKKGYKRTLKFCKAFALTDEQTAKILSVMEFDVMHEREQSKKEK